MPDLAEFINGHRQVIVQEWEGFARSLGNTGAGMNSISLRNHIGEILDAIIKDIETPQNEVERTRKAKGFGKLHSLHVAQAHATSRSESGFNLNQVIAEYRALRSSILQLAAKEGIASPPEITRFNESIDEAVMESVMQYLLLMERYRDQFLAILGHDLRNPLGAVLGAASMMQNQENLTEDQSKNVDTIVAGAERMDRMIRDLLELTGAQLGLSVPIHPAPTDLTVVCQQVIAELHAKYHEIFLEFTREGDLHGFWDVERLTQAVSNLVSNAVHHGEEGQPVRLRAQGKETEVVLDVHNEGPGIPSYVIPNIFEPLVSNAVAKNKESSGLGLGLFIANYVVTGHGGHIDVKSTKEEGTTFTVHLPRHSVTPPNNHGRRI